MCILEQQHRILEEISNLIKESVLSGANSNQASSFTT